MWAWERWGLVGFLVVGLLLGAVLVLKMKRKMERREDEVVEVGGSKPSA